MKTRVRLISQQKVHLPVPSCFKQTFASEIPKTDSSFLPSSLDPACITQKKLLVGQYFLLCTVPVIFRNPKERMNEANYKYGVVRWWECGAGISVWKEGSTSRCHLHARSHSKVLIGFYYGTVVLNRNSNTAPWNNLSNVQTEIRLI